MTDINTMESGAEMDHRIVRDVLGYLIYGDSYPGPGFWIDHPVRKQFKMIDPKDKPDPWLEYFSPSTRIADAWEVVEKMRAGGWHAHIEGNSDNWRALFDDGHFEKWSDADAAPLAICRAALKAVGL